MTLAPLQLQPVGNELAIAWNDATETFLPLEFLRRHCPCAGCGGEPDVLGNVEKPPEVPYTDRSFRLRSYQIIGGYAVQYVLNGGGTPVGVVSSPERAKLLNAMGCEHVIDRKAAGYRFWKDEHTQDEAEWRRLGKDIRGLIGRDVDTVFEHPGRSTFGASVFAAARGGKIVTCAATSGYMIEYDNRHLWMKLKRIVSSHFANYQEAWNANQLICEGKVQPLLSRTYQLEETGEAALAVHRNEIEGKAGVLCLAPEAGLGIDDPELREWVGEDRITLFQRHDRGEL